MSKCHNNIRASRIGHGYLKQNEESKQHSHKVTILYKLNASSSYICLNMVCKKHRRMKLTREQGRQQLDLNWDLVGLGQELQLMLDYNPWVSSPSRKPPKITKKNTWTVDKWKHAVRTSNMPPLTKLPNQPQYYKSKEACIVAR